MEKALRIDWKKLENFMKDVFRAYDFQPEEAALITDVLLTSDLYGIESHGSQRLDMYRGQMKKGWIDTKAQPQLVFESPIAATIDGQRAMGQLVGNQAMNLAIAKAKKTGIGMVTVRNSNHYGIASYYSKMALKEGLIGVSMTNSLPVVVPTYGRQPMMGTNPIAISIPADPLDFTYDCATSVVAFGKLEVKHKEGKEAPLGWGINREGLDETHPETIIQQGLARQAGLYPLGGSSEEFGSHKGFGLSLLVEFLTAGLSQGATSNHNGLDGVSGTCHYFMALDPAAFGDAESIKAGWSRYLEEIRQSDKAQGQDRIYIHGEKEAEKLADRLEHGVHVLPKTLEEMKSLAAELEIECDLL